MKKIYLSILAVVFTLGVTQAQKREIADTQYPTSTNAIPEVVIHSADLTMQVVFIGGTDTVQTTATYGNPAGQAIAKEWHDFIGYTADTSMDGTVGWVSVNHEMIQANDNIGDGGGMTAFKIMKPAPDQIEIVEQTLSDGRTGKFFNVDFVNTVGNTGMNCGGITSSFDGRIWTAEEWFRGSNDNIVDRDLDPFTIGVGTPTNPAPAGFPGFDGQTIEKYQNYNYMVEIDPREAVAVRKQYNWGRQPFEGGAVLDDNQTVYLGADATPGFFTKFVADTPGDFTVGTTYVYKEDIPEKWVEIDNTDLDKMLNFSAEAIAVGATMFNRLEWVAYNPADGKVYMTETGRDNPGGRFLGADTTKFSAPAQHHFARAADQGVADAYDSDYWDYYGRVLAYDPADSSVSVTIEGGPFEDARLPSTVNNYKHLSNPDGLSVCVSGEESYLIINEDLNGSSFGRSPKYISGRVCELWLLDTKIENPTADDLTRIAVVPIGAEVTGAIAIDDNTMLVNSQHPDTDLEFPFNHSLTFALHGFSQASTGRAQLIDKSKDLNAYPNPVSQNLFFNKTMTNIQVFDLNGKVIAKKEQGNSINFSGWSAGLYIVTMEHNGDVFSTKVLKK